jgi:hypothetical protein
MLFVNMQYEKGKEKYRLCFYGQSKPESWRSFPWLEAGTKKERHSRGTKPFASPVIVISNNLSNPKQNSKHQNFVF